MTATYVDTNVLVFAFGEGTHSRRAAARQAIERAALRGDVVTSVLTIDEFLWVRRRESGYPTAIEDARRLLKVPVVQFVAAERAHARSAVEHVARHGLRPRDAFHAAVYESTHCDTLLSTDPDFDRVPGIQRREP